MTPRIVFDSRKRAVIGAVKKITRLDRSWTGKSRPSVCALAQGDGLDGRKVGAVGRGPGRVPSRVVLETHRIRRSEEKAIQADQSQSIDDSARGRGEIGRRRSSGEGDLRSEERRV